MEIYHHQTRHHSHPQDSRVDWNQPNQQNYERNPAGHLLLDSFSWLGIHRSGNINNKETDAVRVSNSHNIQTLCTTELQSRSADFVLNIAYHEERNVSLGLHGIVKRLNFLCEILKHGKLEFQMTLLCMSSSLIMRVSQYSIR